MLSCQHLSSSYKLSKNSKFACLMGILKLERSRCRLDKADSKFQMTLWVYLLILNQKLYRRVYNKYILDMKIKYLTLLCQFQFHWKSLQKIMASEESANEKQWKTEEIVFLTFIGLVCFCSCIYNSFCKKKPDQENLETTERQDQVIKTYQIAQMIISATAFEGLQLTVLQTRLHFVFISEYIVIRCNKSSWPFTV